MFLGIEQYLVHDISRKMAPKDNTERSKEFRRKRMEEPRF